VRILFIDKFFPPIGGPGSYTRCVGEALCRRGHDIMQFGCDTGRPPDAENADELPEFRDFTQTGGSLLRGLPSLARMIHNTEAANKLERFCRRNPPDVAHLHNIYHHLTPSVLAPLARAKAGIVMRLADYRLACPVKHFLRPRGHCMLCHPNRFFHAASPDCAGLGGAGLAVETYFHRVARSYFRWVDFFICPTQFMRRTMLELGAPAGKLVVLRNAVPNLKPPHEASEGPPELLFAGRMSFEKAPERMLELAQRIPDAAVTLAGDGPLLQQLKHSAEQSGLGNVTFTGHVPHDGLGRLIARASAVVITSRWLENSTMSMLEAMRAGRCVIVPDRGPLVEWIRDGVTGRTYRADDVDSLERVAREVLSGAEDRRRMGTVAAELVARRHEPGLIAERLEVLYEAARARCALRW